MEKNTKKFVRLSFAALILSGTSLSADDPNDIFNIMRQHMQEIERNFFNGFKVDDPFDNWIKNRSQVKKHGYSSLFSGNNPNIKVQKYSHETIFTNEHKIEKITKDGESCVIITDLKTGETKIIKNKNDKSICIDPNQIQFDDKECDIEDPETDGTQICPYSQPKNQTRQKAPQQNSFPGFFGPGVGAHPETMQETKKFKKYNQNKNSAENVTFDDVIGNNYAKEELRDIADYFKEPAKYNALGATPSHVLLVGPPGTGKTLLAKALANEAGCSFFQLSGPEIESKWVGESAKNVRDLFTKARKNAPSIIFIDEIDSIGRSRDQTGKSRNDAERKPLLQLFTEMDGFNNKNNDAPNVIVIAATNRVDDLDPALRRGGRFGPEIQVSNPNKKDRKKLWEYYFAKHKPATDVNEKYADDLSMRARFISSKGRFVTGSDIKEIMKAAAKAAAKERSKCTEKKHIETALKKYMYGQENKIERTEKQIKRVSYHEAGHTVVAKIFGIDVSMVSIISRSNAAGMAVPKETGDIPDYTEQRLKNTLAILFAGRASEVLFCNTKDGGAEDDLRRANKLANEMISKFAMGMDVNILSGNEEENRKKAAKLQKEQYNEAVRILNENAKLVHALAKALMKKEELNEKEINKIFAQNSSK